MKWYIFNDIEDSDTVNMILDHNTTPMVIYTDINSTLEEDTKIWNSEVLKGVRLIKIEDILKITGNLDFDITDNSSTYFYFDSNSEEKVANQDNASNYSWLFDYTYDCINAGCVYDDNNSYPPYTPSGRYIWGYFTDNIDSRKDNSFWYVGSTGRINTNLISTSLYGIRPVITIDRSLIS